MPRTNDNKDVDPYKEYLKEKFDSLLDKVGDGYGPSLQEELVRRLEITVDRFNSEVKESLQTLKVQSEQREASLKKMLVEDFEDVEPTGDDQPSEEVSDWERKLEAREKKKQKEPASKIKSKEKPKKGLFGRKKS